ncbi:DNA alkylation repair protein [Paenibacillus sp. CF384]|uniref:DNA alkylation repair protein n=1 Tax=Paenibacillus sp. CF384 TaxID=1884382 RepID=UPI000894F73E|nr:DNA alkylation repair protein [Paenibacillus sp. CF384]SDX55114.1 3-methyladenine DNA glycosylase AlkD [Paenibacillus sp. CF384]
MNTNERTEIKRSSKAENILQQINSKTMLGDLRKIAKDIIKDHELAMELWSTEKLLPRLLAILIMDKKLLSEDVLNKLDKDMQIHTFDERNNLMDWLMANQLTKDKKNIALMELWGNSPSALQRRAFWYYQGRLRWTGQTPPDNTEDLLLAIEATIEQEEPEVQWAMNFTAGWIGVYDQKNRARCIELGEKTGLYKDQMVAKNCTPNYLPAFIAIEVNKRMNK